MKEEKIREKIESRTPIARASMAAGGLAPAGPPSEIYWRSPIEAVHEFDRYFNEMRRNMENMILTPPTLWNVGAVPRAAEEVLARADVEDTGKEFVVAAELPGFDKDEIHVEVSEHRIEIEARRERVKSEEKEEKGFLTRERAYTRVSRSFEFPEEVRPDDVEAEYRNGVLCVTVPKKSPTPSERKTKVHVK